MKVSCVMHRRVCVFFCECPFVRICATISVDDNVASKKTNAELIRIDPKKVENNGRRRSWKFHMLHYLLIFRGVTRVFLISSQNCQQTHISRRTTEKQDRDYSHQHSLKKLIVKIQFWFTTYHESVLCNAPACLCIFL